MGDTFCQNLLTYNKLNCSVILSSSTAFLAVSFVSVRFIAVKWLHYYFNNVSVDKKYLMISLLMLSHRTSRNKVWLTSTMQVNTNSETMRWSELVLFLCWKENSVRVRVYCQVLVWLSTSHFLMILELSICLWNEYTKITKILSLILVNNIENSQYTGRFLANFSTNLPWKTYGLVKIKSSLQKFMFEHDFNTPRFESKKFNALVMSLAAACSNILQNN